MNGRDLIFSRDRKHRVARHLAFWVIYTFYFYPQGIWYPETIANLLKPGVYVEALINFLFFIPACIFATYTGIYVLLPRFLQRKRYKSFLIFFVLLFLACLCLNYYASEWYFVFSPHSEKETTVAGTLYLSYVNSMAAITLSGISIGLKITKNWSVQHKENLAIAKKKARTELQFHKARIHPQFLFRTLESIYTRITSDQEDTPEMVLRLSDLLSYSLYCGKGKLVPLMQEISTLRDLTFLENRQQHRMVHITVEAEGDYAGHYIPPMTILSLVNDM
ncbi:MAG TPA: histidine kinase, partial [Sphingobacteriaceae bacterium]